MQSSFVGFEERDIDGLCVALWSGREVMRVKGGWGDADCHTAGGDADVDAEI